MSRNYPEIHVTKEQQAHLSKIACILDGQGCIARDYRGRQAFGKKLSKARLAMAKSFAQLYLQATKISIYQVHHDGVRPFLEGKGAKQLVEAVASVPNLTLDHTFAFKKDGLVIALVTMPYDTKEEFVSDGENEVAVWRSHDDLSWWFPGATKLTIIYTK